MHRQELLAKAVNIIVDTLLKCSRRQKGRMRILSYFHSDFSNPHLFHLQHLLTYLHLTLAFALKFFISHLRWDAFNYIFVAFTW